MKWIPISKPPKKSGIYLVCAPTLDPKIPLRQLAFYFHEEKEWAGVVPYWVKYLTHYMPYPKTPHDKPCKGKRR